VFAGATGTVTLNSPQSATSLTFNTNGYTITGSTLTLGPTPANITTDPGVTATIASAIAGSATMTKLGLGMLILANSNNTNTATSSEGGWRIEGGGTLMISADGALGVAPGTNITDIQLNQSTIWFGADMDLSINRRTKVNTNSATQNLGDAIIDVNEHVVRWFGSIQGGLGTLRVTDGNNNGGMLVLGTDKVASINPFGSGLPAGTVNLTVENHVVVQTSGQVTPTGGELGSETGAGGAALAIKLQSGGQIRSESGGYTFKRNLILGNGGGSLDTGAWIQTFQRGDLGDGGTISGPGSLSKYGTGTLVLDNIGATWTGGTFIHAGTMQLGVSGSNGLLPGTLAAPTSVVIDAGATLKFLRGSNKSYFDNISGGGGVTVANSNNAKVRLVSNNTYTGLTRIDSGTLMIGQGNSGEPGSIVSDVLNNGTLDFNRVEDLTYGGAISGNGNLVKEAAGKLTLTGTSSYTGSTTVLAGTLQINSAWLADSADVSLATAIGSTLNLNFSGSDTIRSLLFDGVSQYLGTWGAIGSGAEFTSPRIAGTGRLQVTVGPLPGDFNFDGTVDAADYVMWRKTGGPPDGYTIWRTNFGRTTGGGSGSNATVPEPATALLFVLGAAIACRRTTPIRFARSKTHRA
jgi:autotransporter-associated beta strand protein